MWCSTRSWTGRYSGTTARRPETNRPLPSRSSHRRLRSARPNCARVAARVAVSPVWLTVYCLCSAPCPSTPISSPLLLLAEVSCGLHHSPAGSAAGLCRQSGDPCGCPTMLCCPSTGPGPLLRFRNITLSWGAGGRSGSRPSGAVETTAFAKTLADKQRMVSERGERYFSAPRVQPLSRPDRRTEPGLQSLRGSCSLVFLCFVLSVVARRFVLFLCLVLSVVARSSSLRVGDLLGRPRGP